MDGVISGTKIVFVSTQEWAPWGGSEELWWQTAMRLHQDGISVSACVPQWSPPDKHIDTLIRNGVEVFQHELKHPLWRRVLRRIIGYKERLATKEIESWIAPQHPSLIVVSDGFALPPIDLLEMLAKHSWPFITISHANHELWWPSDGESDRYSVALDRALKCYFVANANRDLIETQIGFRLSNSAIVRNPHAVPLDFCAPWPPMDKLRMACVGRLEPGAKGQDILLKALSTKEWRERNWHLSLYGTGRNQQCLQRICGQMCLADRVSFEGYRPVTEIWKANHVLVLPSRYEGLPIAIVDAMMCGRPVVATDVGGNCELIEDSITGFVASAPKVSLLADTLERLWQQRDKLEQIGRLAAASIRNSIPQDPPGVFAEELKRLAESCARTA